MLDILESGKSFKSQLKKLTFTVVNDVVTFYDIYAPFINNDYNTSIKLCAICNGSYIKSYSQTIETYTKKSDYRERHSRN